MAKLSEVFGRVNDLGNVEILYIEDGSPAECVSDAPIHVDNINTHPREIASNYANIRHPSDRVIVRMRDAIRLGIEIE